MTADGNGRRHPRCLTCRALELACSYHARADYDTWVETVDAAGKPFVTETERWLIYALLPATAADGTPLEPWDEDARAEYRQTYQPHGAADALRREMTADERQTGRGYGNGRRKGRRHDFRGV